MVWQMTEKHHRKIYDPDCQQAPGRWEYSQPHIWLAAKDANDTKTLE
jgi:hypothetical protein